jgi:probable HAF family extracellular repeat protein
MGLRGVGVGVGVVAALALMTPAQAGAAAGGRYVMVDLGARVVATAISDSDVVVGDAVLGGGQLRAFRWKSGQIALLGSLGVWSHAVAVSSSGDVVGNTVTSSGDVHGFIWRAGVMTDLGTLGGSTSMVTGVNARDMVIGTSTTGVGDTHAFLWAAGQMTDLGTLGGTCSTADAINDRGQIVGEAGTSVQNLNDPCGEEHPYIWRGGRMRDLNIPYTAPPGDANFSPGWGLTINNAGAVAGGYVQRGDSGSQDSLGILFRWNRHAVTFLGPLVYSGIWVTGQNARGDIAGTWFAADDDDHRFRGVVWTRNHVTVFDTQVFVHIVGMDNSGTAAGYDRSLHSPDTSGTAFTWHAGVRTNLGVPGDDAQATAINATGTVIGATYINGIGHAVLWKRG